MCRLSVIIPTLNEAATLPNLLDALRTQTRPPDEIIVADAGSNDGTADLAHTRGARVIPGGRPGVGRNAGARIATGNIFLFLDADVLPPSNFIAEALAEFTRTGCDVATCLIEPLSDSLSDKLITEMVNLYLQVLQPLSPRAPGFCILVRREIHQRIGGFNETVKLAEDHDYVQRGARHGYFAVLTSVHIAVSMRRLEKEGLTQLVLKYLWCEMHALAGKPIYFIPFEYEFGAHLFPPAASGASQHVISFAHLRERLSRFENPIQRLSAVSPKRLEGLIHRDWMDSTWERLWSLLDARDRVVLRRYLRWRLALIRSKDWPLRQTLFRLRTLPIEGQFRWLDLYWLRQHRRGLDTPEDRKD